MEKLAAGFILLTVTGTSLVFGTLDCDSSCKLSNQFDLDVKTDDSNIDLRWTFNQSKPIYGFQMIIYNDDDDITYESPILHSSERSMNLQHELDGDAKICLVAFVNSTTILDQKCHKIDIKDLKIIIGILAGTIFLIPCLAGLTYIIYKDYRVKYVEQYRKMDSDLEIKRNKSEASVHITDEKNSKKTDKKVSNSVKAAENKAFVDDEYVQQQSKTAEPVAKAAVATVNVKCSAGTNPENSIQEKNKVEEDGTASSETDSDNVETKDSVEKDSGDNQNEWTLATDNLKESNKVVDKLEEDTVCVTEEDVSGTTL